ncbi:amino acid adenylation domain-containing protein [Peterkaempfera sp. SMS 1(5)a]|uniref:non-ribosomal peptide synthetase n=1 Tax=Peterkaempfera podocarpi TaxID=3232308 RepID=UPI00366AAD83
MVHEVARDHRDEDLTALAREVRARIADEHGVRPRAVVLIRAATLPRTSSGKVQRHAVAAAYQQGGLHVLALDGSTAAAGEQPGSGLPDPEVIRAAADGRPAMVLSALQELLVVRLGVDRSAVSDTCRLTDLGLDSLGAVRLHHELSSWLGAELSLTELMEQDLAGLAGLIAAWLDAPAGSAQPPAAQSRTAETAPGDYALTRNQAALWFLQSLVPDSAANHVATCFEITGADPVILTSAIEDLVARHPALRSTFPQVGDAPVQRIHAELRPDIRSADLRGRPQAELARSTTEATDAPFDLAGGTPLRVRLLRTGAETHRVVLTAHHLVADLWSMSLLLDELDTVYRARAAGEAPVLPLATGHGAVAERQAARLGTDDGRRLLENWTERFRTAPGGAVLPTDHRPPRVPGMAGDAVPFALSTGTTTALVQLARTEGVTVHSVILTAYQVALARSSGQYDVVVGTPVHGRADAELAATVGCLVNTVPARTSVDLQEPFSSLVRRVHRDVLPGLTGADVPFAALVAGLRPARDTGARPLVRTCLSLQQAPGPRAQALAALAVGHAGVGFPLGGLPCRTVGLPVTSSQFDLQLMLAVIGGSLVGSLRYDTELYRRETAETFAARLTALLETAAREPATPVGDLPVLAPQEHQGFQAAQCGPELPCAADLPVHHRIEQTAARHPGATAVASAEQPGRRLTFSELDGKANGIARRLLESGVRPGEVVGVLLPRTPELVAALLGVLKAGAAYLPLDPQLPEERLAFMVRDAGVRVVLADSTLPQALGRIEAVEPQDCPSRATAPRVEPVHPETPAYVIYTSGSTGTPKGVAVPHRALANLLVSFEHELQLSPGSGWLSVTTPSFDIAALEYFLPLVNGATVHLADARTAADGSRLRACLERGGVTHLQATPVTWQLLQDAGWTGTPGLTALCGGERMPAELTRLLPAAGVRLWNVYGPTETTVWSLVCPVPGPVEEVPLGRPIGNTRRYVLDARLRPVPPGCTGELHLGGDGVAQGYLGRPGLTAGRFLPDPFTAAPGARMYRTGDLVRLRRDGSLDFVGREDAQVKVHGHRIELGEIETALERDPLVRRAAVVLEGSGASARLVAHVETDAAESAPEALRSGLRTLLPSYAVPSLFVATAALPLTANGKVDRRALPSAASTTGTSAAYEAPRDATEQRIARVLCELMPVERVGRNDDLFDLGAHSLLMARLLERLRREFDSALPMRELFTNPTVAGLAAAVRDADRPAHTGAVRAVLRPVDRAAYTVERGADGTLRRPAALIGENR